MLNEALGVGGLGGGGGGGGIIPYNFVVNNIQFLYYYIKKGKEMHLHSLELKVL